MDRSIGHESSVTFRQQPTASDVSASRNYSWSVFRWVQVVGVWRWYPSRMERHSGPDRQSSGRFRLSQWTLAGEPCDGTGVILAIEARCRRSRDDCRVAEIVNRSNQRGFGEYRSGSRGLLGSSGEGRRREAAHWSVASHSVTRRRLAGEPDRRAGHPLEASHGAIRRLLAGQPGGAQSRRLCFRKLDPFVTADGVTPHRFQEPGCSRPPASGQRRPPIRG
jgi:hypothetical protein